MSEDWIDVLFVCTHNAGRSIAAKIIFNDRASKLGLGLRAQSAGTNPGDHVNPAVRRILESFNLDVSGEVPRLLTDEMLGGSPRVVTMGCEMDTETCPAVNFAEVDDWGLPDPSKISSNDAIVPLIHDIARRVNTLIQEMTGER